MQVWKPGGDLEYVDFSWDKLKEAIYKKYKKANTQKQAVMVKLLYLLMTKLKETCRQYTIIVCTTKLVQSRRYAPKYY